jgi:hypothetical protein
VGQENDSQENLRLAQQYFQLVGGSASECGERWAAPRRPRRCIRRKEGGSGPVCYARQRQYTIGGA